MLRSLLSASALLIGALFSGLVLTLTPTKAQDRLHPWFDIEAPLSGEPRVIGGYAAGCIAGAAALPEDDGEAGYYVMRPGRNRFFGHPRLIALLRDLAREMRAEGWPGLLIGDLSQPRGGPMRSGHRSHQIGLDADIWFRPAPPAPRDENWRESLSATSVLDGGGLSAQRWTAAQEALLRRAAEKQEVARIFVNPAIKRVLCAVESGEREWLRKLRPWWGHDDHMHLRLSCPPGEALCVDQEPPPPGDGCDETLAWWFSAEAKAEARRLARLPKAPPPSLAELPAACRPILGG